MNMKKWLIPILAVAGLFGACSSGSQHVDARVGKNFVFSTSVGSEFTVELSANPSTGYDWCRDFDPSMLTLAGIAFDPGPGATLGSGGTLSLRFKALKPGDTKMTLFYVRGSETQAADQKILTVSID